jgi:hypothetical protein
MCDGKENTISIIESEYGNIFGGFTFTFTLFNSLAWQSLGHWKHDNKAWLFSLTHKTIHRLSNNHDTAVVYFNKEALCSFGDFRIMHDSSKPVSGSSIFGLFFKPIDEIEPITKEANNYMTGSPI